MSNRKSGRITEQEMGQPSEYGGEPKRNTDSGLKQSPMRDLYRSDPTDPNSGPTT